jgi:hypothetical protein
MIIVLAPSSTTKELSTSNGRLLTKEKGHAAGSGVRVGTTQ